MYLLTNGKLVFVNSFYFNCTYIGPDGAAIVGAVVGVILLATLIVIVIMIVLIINRRRR